MTVSEPSMPSTSRYPIPCTRIHHSRRARRRARPLRKADGRHRRRVPADDRGVSQVEGHTDDRLSAPLRELNLTAIDLARGGRLGELKFFNSSFSMKVRRGDIRTKRACGGGTLYDIGVYCINAARNLFRAEPTQVSAVSVNSGLSTLAEVDETTAAILRFGDGRVATFVTSFNAADVASYRIVGTKGDLHADPAYEYAEGLEYTLTVDGKTTRKALPKRDQFGPQLLYFSDCILTIASPNRRARRAFRTSGLWRRSTNQPNLDDRSPFVRLRRPYGRPDVSG